MRRKRGSEHTSRLIRLRAIRLITHALGGLRARIPILGRGDPSLAERAVIARDVAEFWASHSQYDGIRGERSVGGNAVGRVMSVGGVNVDMGLVNGGDEGGWWWSWECDVMDVRGCHMATKSV